MSLGARSPGEAAPCSWKSLRARVQAARLGPPRPPSVEVLSGGTPFHTGQKRLPCPPDGDWLPLPLEFRPPSGHTCASPPAGPPPSDTTMSLEACAPGGPSSKPPTPGLSRRNWWAAVKDSGPKTAGGLVGVSGDSGSLGSRRGAGALSSLWAGWYRTRGGQEEDAARDPSFEARLGVSVHFSLPSHPFRKHDLNDFPQTALGPQGATRDTVPLLKAQAAGGIPWLSLGLSPWVSELTSSGGSGEERWVRWPREWVHLPRTGAGLRG